MALEVSSFESLFNPGSVAVVGASNVPGKWGFILPLNLVLGGYKGKLYYVNPKEKVIHGYKAYKSLTEIPEPVELVVITVPASSVPSVMEEAGKKGVKAAIVISSGFSEVGEEGKKLEERVCAIATGAGIRMIGPNTMGICSPPTKLYAMGLSIAPKPGHIAFMSQSGNLGVQVLGWAERAGLGISRFISSGNEGQTTCDQVLEYYGQDPLSKVIILYLEGIDYGERFLELARRISRVKPIVVLKVGVTEAGIKAAQSHSGAVATSHRVYQALVKQAGIIEAESTEELIDLARTFGNLPIPRGKRVGIMTLGGGWGVVTTDLCAREGLELPGLSRETIDRIDRVLPKFWSHGNPVDMVGTVQRSAHFEVLEALSADPNFDIILTLGSLLGFGYSREEWTRVFSSVNMLIKRYGIYMMRFFLSIARGVRQSLKEVDKVAKLGKTEKSGGVNLKERKAWSDEIFTEKVKDLMRAYGKPIVPVAFDASAVPVIFRKFGIVTFGIPEKAVMAVKKLADYGAFLARRREAEEKEIYELVTEDVAKAAEIYLDKFEGPMSEYDAKILLESYGISVARGLRATSEEDALKCAKEIGFPVVMKIDSADILHKTEAGAVKLNLNSEDEVRKAYEEIIENVKAYKKDARISGVLVCEMVKGGTEVMVGVSEDPCFGLTLVVGLGGIWVEALEDVSLRILPVTRADVLSMLEELKGMKLLKGFRKEKPKDVDALVEIIVRAGRLAYDQRDRIKEMDLNPVVVLEQGRGAKALDALVVLKPRKPKD